jgi:hypothetical protein
LIRADGPVLSRHPAKQSAAAAVLSTRLRIRVLR